MDSNNLQDRDFANILTGVEKLQDIKTLIYNRNVFGIASAEALRHIINEKSIPHHLEELRIINCKISSNAMAMLLDTLNRRNFIKRLSLVNANLGNENCISKLNTLIVNTRYDSSQTCLLP